MISIKGAGETVASSESKCEADRVPVASNHDSGSNRSSPP